MQFAAGVCERHGELTRVWAQDMGLATDLAEATGSALPLGQVAEKIYGDVVSEDPELADKDFSSVYRYLRTAYPKA